MLVCIRVCVHELLSPSACFSCLFSPSLSSPACTPVIHSHAQEMNPPRKKHTQKKKRHHGRLPTKSTRGQSALVWENRGTSFVLLWCSQVKQRKECWERGTSLGGGGREREREREIKWREQRDRGGDRFVCVCVWGRNLREEMGALRVLFIPFSSSHSWEIWSIELGGTNTQTQINCCLENKSSFPFISLRCSISPCWSSGAAV